MSLPGFSVARPVFVSMVVAIALVLGSIAFWRLPIDLMPDITYPTITVSARYEGAGPEEVETLVTRPIEEALSAVPGVEEITSNSSEGNSRVRVTFVWGTDLDAATADVRDRLDSVTARLPDEADRPSVRKFDLAAFPILIFGAASDLDPVQLRHLLEHDVKNRIERVPGVAALDVQGGQVREIHVDVSPEKLKALDLPLDTIVARLKAENVNVPAGPINRGSLDVLVRTPGEFQSLEELRDTVVAVRAGKPLRLREIADVNDAWERETRIVRVNGRRGVRLSVNKQSGTNTVEVARGVLAEVERINADLPQVHISPIIDTSGYVERAVAGVGSSAVYGGLLAVGVLLFFLRNVRSTAVVATAIPVSVVLTFAPIYFGGLTLNIMTLGGLALGVGMLVDNAIVVLENIFRLREQGLDRHAAAEAGASEVTTAIVASTITTLVVFLPMVFMRGMAGLMFKQLALVVTFALVASLFVAITFVPMLAARLLAPDGRAGRGWAGRLAATVGGGFTWLETAYRDTLAWNLRHRVVVLVGTTALLAGSIALVPLIGTELMPQADEGEVRISGEMETGTRVTLLEERFKQIEAIVDAQVPEQANNVAYLGGSSWRAAGSHTGQLRVSLTPATERTRTNDEITNLLRKALADIPGLTVRTRSGQGLFLLRAAFRGGDRIEVRVQGHDLETSDRLAAQVRERLLAVDGVTDARVSRESGSPEEVIRVDRAKAAALQLSVARIADMLQTVLAGTPAGLFREGGDEARILVKVQNAEQRSLKELLDLTLTNAGGHPVVLRNVVRIESRTGPVQIDRQDQERVTTVNAEVAGRPLGAVAADIQAALHEIVVPQDFRLVLGGEFESQQEAFQELLLSLVLAIVLVYMVLACLYESLIDPLVVLGSVPLAAIGVILLLLLTDTTFNIQSFIGCIMLGGIVVNNAILLVDHTNLLIRRDRLPPLEAIVEAGRRRLRPILMTAATTILGLVPLALALGEGGEAQAPMARAVIGGLLSSTVITLVLIPTILSFTKRPSAPAPGPATPVRAAAGAGTP